MSVIPFNTLKQADDFFSIYLSTADTQTGSENENPRWLYTTTNQGILDRYKNYKRCWGVVDYVSIPRDNGLPTADVGGTICLRMRTNQQPNSFQSKTNSANAGGNSDQSDIIYMASCQRVIGTENGGGGPPTQPGFPFEVMNPFGPIELAWTSCFGTDGAYASIDMGANWAVKMTYYFYDKC